MRVTEAPAVVADDEAALVARARAGDVPAYEELVRRYQEVAQRTAWLVAGSESDASDVAQDAFVKAYGALGRFRDGHPFRPWLLRIVANEARNRRRAAGRAARLVLRAGLAGAEPAASAESMVLERERREELLAALRRMSERDRLAIACRYLLELSEAETAAVLGCPRGTVKSRLSRALGRLRTELGGAG